MSSTEREGSPEARAARNSRNKGRLRLEQAAAQGTHLPTTKELILGCQFMGKDIRLDAAAFAERVLGRVDTTTDAGRQVFAAVSTLTATPDLAAFELAAAAIRAAVDAAANMPDFGIDVGAVLDRLDYAAANLGSPQACIRVAQCALDFANGDDTEIDEISLLTEAAIGWLASARAAQPFTLRGRDRMSKWSEHRLAASRDGDRLIKSILRYHELLGGDIIAAHADVADVLADAQNMPPVRRLRIDGRRVLDIDLDRHEIEGLEAVQPPPGLVVISEIGMPETSEGKRVAEVFKGITATRSPLVTVPKSLTGVRATLAAEFPHAAAVVNAVLGDLRDGEPIRLRPTILVGEPGCGKTTLARRVLALLRVPSELYPCGGQSDSSIAGTARRWSSGEPSLPLALIRRHKICNPAIILDEVEKAGTSRHNGNMLDALIGMLEPTSASCWHDPYVQAGVDISHVNWIGTANSIDGIPTVLRDRCRIVRLPDATSAHLPVLANSLLRAAISERGLPDAWALPLDGAELSALAECWTGGSIRKLGRLVVGVLVARDHGAVQS